MGVKVRRLNNKGINTLRMYLDDLREGNLEDIPEDFLYKKEFSEETSDELSANEASYENNFEMAKSLHYDLIFDGKGGIWSDVGLWSWISVYLFDQTCPKIDGFRKPGEDYRYILEVSRVGGGWSRFYRHLIVSPVRLYDFHRENSKILLSSNINQQGDMIEQFASAMERVQNRTIISVLNTLYYDSKNDTVKKGALAYRKPGTHRRYRNFLEQIGLTFDLQSMNDEDLIDLLPSEFDPWLQS